MNDIPLSELNAFRRIENQFDGAYVSLLTKLSQFNQETTESDQSKDNADQEDNKVSKSQDESSESDEESSEDASEAGESEECTEDDANPADLVQSELITLALCFAKLMTKSLLSVERAASLEAQVCQLQRENCTLRAIATNYQELCLSANKDKDRDSPKRKLHSTDLIAFKSAIEQEIDSLIESQTKNVQRFERKYKNHIFALSLAVDYLKKELSGRVQQLQIYDRLLLDGQAEQTSIASLEGIWNEITGEIILNRHKTIVRLTEAASQDKQLSDADHGPPANDGMNDLDTLCSLLVTGCPLTGPKMADFTKLGQLQFVSIYIEKDKTIGLWIGGGDEQHMPLYFQHVVPDSIAGKTGLLCSGDIILSIQNFDMIGTTQKYAAQLLKSISGWCRLGIVRIPVNDVVDYLSKQNNFELLFDNFIENEDEDHDESTSTSSESESSELSQ